VVHRDLKPENLLLAGEGTGPGELEKIFEHIGGRVMAVLRSSANEIAGKRTFCSVCRYLRDPSRALPSSSLFWIRCRRDGRRADQGRSWARGSCLTQEAPCAEIECSAYSPSYPPTLCPPPLRSRTSVMRSA
jgi:serine/threonine protein kinase